MSELFPSFSSNALFLFASASTFSHLSLVRTWKEPGNNRQGRRLISPQRIRACSRERSLEEGWSEKQQVLVTKRSETLSVPWEASTGARENVPNSDEYMERSKLNLLFSNYLPLGDIETFITEIHPEQANQVVRMEFKISIKEPLTARRGKGFGFQWDSWFGLSF